MHLCYIHNKPRVVLWQKVSYDTTSQASKTNISLFCSKQPFYSPSECKYVLFVCLSVRLKVSFIPMHFRYFGRKFSLRTVDLSTESHCATHSTIFADKTRNYFSRTLPTAKLKSAKNNPHVFATKPRKFGDAKISHYTVQ